MFPKADASLEEAQDEKFDLVARKLALEPGMRLLDVGCGWGGMARHAAKHYGAQVVAVTLSKEQADWATAAVQREGLGGQVRIVNGDYRDSPGQRYDAISSIGLLEHVGVANYASYFGYLHGKLRDGGRLLNHCITRPDNVASAMPGQFIDRYVFPDGELTGFGTDHHRGAERRLRGPSRGEPARALRADAARVVRQPRHPLGRVRGRGGRRDRARLGAVHGRLAAGLRDQRHQLHQVLGVRVPESGDASFPLRPNW